ncbi:MAG: guanosine-3',5'-bis(diphosphate) 3'-pyrophosphohydrolase [Arenicella sp.]|jgi:guanosine-3',5'-bis(diphosphate) 3'-pyrophosphohydrolase
MEVFNLTHVMDLQLFIKALVFAAHKHKDQRRKDVDASPYINHPIALIDVLVNEGGVTDMATICAALLHDTVEDTEATAEELATQFGDEIASIVMEVSDDKTLSKEDRKQAQVKHSAHLSTKAKAVKLADKTSNLRDMIKSPPEGWSLERRQKYFDWSKEVVDGFRGDWPKLEAVFDEQDAPL